MVEYVRGSQIDRWHWCGNCTQYPMYIYQKTSSKPSSSELCEQCKVKEENGNCRCEEISEVQERHLNRQLAVFCETF
ncbi:TPA: hypothetical protein HA274_00070 [Candidatus Bathyarchaeota archaeon]|nr:hypothetical protein [Candidatus Bathyarchaeota archaeon]